MSWQGSIARAALLLTSSSIWVLDVTQCWDLMQCDFKNTHIQMSFSLSESKTTLAINSIFVCLPFRPSESELCLETAGLFCWFTTMQWVSLGLKPCKCTCYHISSAGGHHFLNPIMCVPTTSHRIIPYGFVFDAQFASATRLFPLPLTTDTATGSNETAPLYTCLASYCGTLGVKYKEEKDTPRGIQSQLTASQENMR